MDDHESSTAYNFAKKAHEGQFRRDRVTPYFNHSMTVADKVSKYGYEYVCVAYLHDVLEDTNVTSNDLIANGFTQNIVEAVELLTKKETQTYDEYLHGIRSNKLARRVKIADMLSNLGDDPTDKQIVRYAKGLLYLVE